MKHTYHCFVTGHKRFPHLQYTRDERYLFEYDKKRLGMLYSNYGDFNRDLCGISCKDMLIIRDYFLLETREFLDYFADNYNYNLFVKKGRCSLYFIERCYIGTKEVP